MFKSLDKDFEQLNKYYIKKFKKYISDINLNEISDLITYSVCHANGNSIVSLNKKLEKLKEDSED